MKLKCYILIFTLLIIIYPAHAFDLDQETELKIDKLIQSMTLEEKTGQMNQISHEWQPGTVDVEAELKKGNIGSFLFVKDVNLRNHYQKLAVEQSRLGIPVIFGYDVIHGYRTIFPIPLGEAASWDLDLMEKTASIAAKEAKSVGIDWTFSPMVDIARDPRWGRIAEGAGEDTYLGALIVKAKVHGYQGDDLSASDTIAACLKHFAAYGAAQAGREYHTTDVPERILRNIYLPPFKAGVNAGAATLMSGFNDLNGVPATGNRFILTDILRDEWNFNGFVVSDWESVRELIPHGFAKDKAHAAILASTAGVDMDMASQSYYENIPGLVKEGKLSEDVVDEAVRRILRVKYALGLFDNPYIDTNLHKKVILAHEHRLIARQAVRESIVLVKNDDSLLPLDGTAKSIAIIGPLADNKPDLLGTWSVAANADDVVSVIDGLRQKFDKECEINYAKGCDIEGGSTDGFSQAVETANKSEIVIMALGEGAMHSGEAHSRAELNLPGLQLQLLKEIQKTGKRVILLLFTGRPLTINWEMDNISTILIAWHPGIEGGNGIADVLAGDYNPSGKITATFPRHVGQIPLYYNMKNTGRPFNQDVRYTSRYIDMPNAPLLPFGFGLSYTKFSYANLSIKNNKVKIPGSVAVSVDITNTGNYDGHEVVQMYIRDHVGSVTRPVKELKGFQRIFLKKGETKKVEFELNTSDLKFFGLDMEYTVEPGEFTVWIGTSSNEGLEGRFDLY